MENLYVLTCVTGLKNSCPAQRDAIGYYKTRALAEMALRRKTQEMQSEIETGDTCLTIKTIYVACIPSEV